MPTQRKQKIVAFLGAGVSKCLGIPLMAEFTDALRDAQILEPAEQAEFDRIQHQCGQMASIINGTTRNLEFLTSFLATLARIRPDFVFEGNSQYKTPQQALDLVLRCIWALTSVPAKRPDTMCDLLALASAPGFNLAIITTNYDLHIEYGIFQSRHAAIMHQNHLNERASELVHGVMYKTADMEEINTAISESKKGMRRLFPGERVLEKVKTASEQSRVYSNDQGSIPLCKLHGSVNWFRDASDGFVVDEIKRIDRMIVSTAREVAKDVRRWIVPPSVLKPGFDDMIEEQWVRAARHLKEADRVWFIGYSFPETDTFMRYFLAAALFENAQVREIAICDPSDSVAVRAASIFDSPQHQAVFRPFGLTWEQLDFRALLIDLCADISTMVHKRSPA